MTPYTDKAGNIIYGKPHNRIQHFSDWDGTLRTYKAEYVIRRFQPKYGEDMARIWKEQENRECKTIYCVDFAMFLEIPELVEFVKAGRETITAQRLPWMKSTPEENDKWFNYYVTHWDIIDACADTWKLSPRLKRNYPSHFQWFMGSDIGEGWHAYVHEMQYFYFKFDLRTLISGYGKRMP